ncbi:MAG: DUF3990 domain-containing protein [Bacteroidales bacterium]|nr:DUF3990 domain-containing protein [Bacteroidales bacterium]
MKLYHGSIAIVEQPRILDTQRLLDFGKGFYTTTNKDQAERWAIIKQNRLGKTAKSFVTEYEFHDTLLSSQSLNIMIFKQASEEWLDFVVQNRNEDVKHEYDMVIGPVANDTLYQTITLYEAGILTKTETIVRLKVHPLFDQISFHSPKALEHLKFKYACLAMAK